MWHTHQMIIPVYLFSRLSIDSHKLTLIAADGFLIQPIQNLDYIILHSGERYDFIVDADKDSNLNYWIRAETLEINVTSNTRAPFVNFNHLALAVLLGMPQFQEELSMKTLQTAHPIVFQMAVWQLTVHLKSFMTPTILPASIQHRISVSLYPVPRIFSPMLSQMEARNISSTLVMKEKQSCLPTLTGDCFISLHSLLQHSLIN